MRFFRKKAYRQEEDLRWAIQQLRTYIDDRLGAVVKTLGNKIETEGSCRRSLGSDLRADRDGLTKRLDELERLVHTEVRTSCQNTAEATKAIADTMEILRPILLTLREKERK